MPIFIGRGAPVRQGPFRRGPSSSTMTLETDRLSLSVPRLADAPRLFDFLGDMKAMRHTSRLETMRDCRRHIAGHACPRRKVGYGPWTVSAKADGQIIGFGGLYDDPLDPGWGIEVGYAFASQTWNNGFATELTRFCLVFARNELGVHLVRAMELPYEGGQLLMSPAPDQQTAPVQKSEPDVG